MAARNGGIAQLGEHLPCKQGVESSNLLISIEFNKEESFLNSESFLRTMPYVVRLNKHIDNYT